MLWHVSRYVCSNLCASGFYTASNHHVSLLARISQTLSLAIRLYHSSLLVGLPDDILCPYRAVVDKFLLFCQHLHVRVKGSIDERHK